MTAIEKYQLIVFRADTYVCRNVVMNHVHPVSVVNSILPVFWLFAFEHRGKALSIHV